MRLKGEDGTSFELKIEGYQFPEIQDDRWDSNWLVVSGRVAHPAGTGAFAMRVSLRLNSSNSRDGSTPSQSGSRSLLRAISLSRIWNSDTSRGRRQLTFASGTSVLRRG